MSGLRDFVTGSDMCTASGDAAGPSNAVGALVNQLLGGASKTQEELRDVSELIGCALRMQARRGHPAWHHPTFPIPSPVAVTAWRRMQLPMHQGLAGPPPMVMTPEAAAAAARGAPGMMVPGLGPQQGMVSGAGQEHACMGQACRQHGAAPTPAASLSAHQAMSAHNRGTCAPRKRSSKCCGAGHSTPWTGITAEPLSGRCWRGAP